MARTYHRFTVIWRGVWPWKARSFFSQDPLLWTEARDLLINAGVIEPHGAGRSDVPEGWMLSVDTKEYDFRNAELMPVSSETHNC